MDIISEMLTVAAALGALNYVLGSLIYSLPIPIKGIKRWGPYLVQDGILTFLLASSFYLIIWSVNNTYNYLGLDREKLVTEILQISKNIASLYMFLNYIFEIIKQLSKFKLLGLPVGTILEGIYTLYSQYKMFTDIFTRPFLDIFMNSLRVAMYAWTLLYVLSRIMELLMPFFVASGILLIGIPFRIAKSAGAFLLAASIVGYIMGPLVVLVLNLLAQYNPLLSSLWNMFIKIDLPDVLTHVAFVNGKVVDENNHGVPFSIVRFCNANGVCGAYSTNQNGEFTTAYSFGGVPWPSSHVKVEVLGLTIDKGYVDLRKLGINRGQVINKMIIKLKDTYLLDPGLLIRISNGYYTFTSEPTFHMTEEGKLYFEVGIKAISDVNVTIVTSGVFDPKTMGFYLGSGIEKPILRRTSWYGIDVWILTFTVPQGRDVEVAINGYKDSFTPPRLGGSVGYLASELGVKLFGDLENVKYSEYDLLMLPFFLTALPLTHMMLISMVTYGLASLISGGVKRISIRLW